MNIFFLDSTPANAALYHCDIHVNSQIGEGVQILNAAIKGPTAAWGNHPCSVWARESLDNWFWLYQLVHSLNTEYKYRFNKRTDHGAMANMPAVPPLPQKGLTRVPLCIGQGTPEWLRIDDAVLAYREYYCNKLGRGTTDKGFAYRKRFQAWAYTCPPYWWPGWDDVAGWVFPAGRLWCNIDPTDSINYQALRKEQALAELDLKLDFCDESDLDEYFLDAKPTTTRASSKPELTFSDNVAEHWYNISYSNLPAEYAGRTLDAELIQELNQLAEQLVQSEPDPVVRIQNYILNKLPRECKGGQWGTRKVKKMLEEHETEADLYAFIDEHINWWASRGHGR